jgi:hypothetical protein
VWSGIFICPLQNESRSLKMYLLTWDAMRCGILASMEPTWLTDSSLVGFSKWLTCFFRLDNYCWRRQWVQVTGNPISFPCPFSQGILLQCHGMSLWSLSMATMELEMVRFCCSGNWLPTVCIGAAEVLGGRARKQVIVLTPWSFSYAQAVCVHRCDLSSEARRWLVKYLQTRWLPSQSVPGLQRYVLLVLELYIYNSL